MTTLLMAAILALSPAERDSLLERTPGKEAFWEEMLELEDEEIAHAAGLLFAEIPRLDRLEMTEEVLMDHILGARHSRDVFYAELPDSIYERYLLHYRLDEEPVSPYRTFLSSFWRRRLPSQIGLDQTCDWISSWMSDNLDLTDASYFGGIASPEDVIRAGGGTVRELRVLLGASLKSLGIAARPVHGWFRGPQGGHYRWLELWDGRTWVPFTTAMDSLPDGFDGLAMAICFSDQSYLTDSYAPTGLLSIDPLPDSTQGEWTLGICVPRQGALEPLDWAVSDPLRQDSVRLGEGSYYVNLCLRRPEGAVVMWTGIVEISAGETTIVDLDDARGVIMSSPYAPSEGMATE